MAMARHCQGQGKLARQTLAEANITFDWSAAQADNRDVLMCHVLRREAEAMILPNLPAFLRGDYQPSDNDERLLLVGICQFEGRTHVAARLYADAFASDPALAEALTSACRSRATQGDKRPVGRVDELATVCRYAAARCAALAGCGFGKDGTRLDEPERRSWRKQAREWLRADLAVWSRTLDSGSRAACDVVTKLLTHLQADPDLAGLREPNALEKLSADEREECSALWKDIAALLDRVKKAK
jgi:serine/threonine-protein kinase